MGGRFASLGLALALAAGTGASAACKSIRPADPLAACVRQSSPMPSLTPAASAAPTGLVTSALLGIAIKPDGDLITSGDIEPSLVDAIRQCVHRQGATYHADCDANGYQYTAHRVGVCSLVSRTAEDATRQRLRVLLIPPIAATAKGADELLAGSRLVIFERRHTTWVALSDTEAFKP